MPIQFADYAIWQRDWLHSGELERQIGYWRRKLANCTVPLPLPLSRPRPLRRNGLGEIHAFTIEGESVARLRGLCSAIGATPFMAMVALFKVVLARSCGARDIVIGSPIADRNRAETEGLIGYLTNLLVLRTEIGPGITFREVLTRVRSTVLEAQQHANCPFDLLVSTLAEPREAGVHPLFQVKCAEQEAGAFVGDLGGVTLAPYPESSALVHFDLSLDFTVSASAIDCSLTYASDIFDGTTIEALANCLRVLATLVASDPERPVEDWVRQAAAAPLVGPQRFFDDSILAGWTRHLASSPDEICICQGERQFSRRQVDGHAAYLAAKLAAYDLGAEARIAIYADRSCEFVVGVLAALMAGAAFVPLDPALPVERLQLQMQDSGAALHLCASEPQWSNGIPAVVLELGSPAPGTLRRPVARVHPEQAAYVIYTSGSTGRPKGVVVSHGALANYVQAVVERLALGEGERRLGMVSTVAADLGHTVLFAALQAGRVLDLVPTEVAFDPDAFADYLRRHQIDVLKIVPSHLRALLTAARPDQVLPASRLILGGEATSWDLLEQINDLKPSCQVLNHYGPTETTVGILVQEAESAYRDAAMLPLGSPLANCTVYVLDDQLEPLPTGLPGELYLGGANLARGYEEQPGHTAVRYIASPFGHGERLYRTGDRARLVGEGQVEFLGRSDDQVKVRGYRVELGEVAYLLRLQPGVAQAEVIAVRHEVDGIRLVGYVTLMEGALLDGDQLRRTLEGSLPDHMVPDTIVILTSMPLTANGKVDRNALPAPGTRKQAAYEAPVGEIESILATVWADVLGVKRVGREDNFFSLGGDSILSLKVVARSRKLGVKLRPRQIFEHQSLATLASSLGHETESSDEQVPPNGIPDRCEAIEPSMLPLVALDTAAIRRIEEAVPGGAANIQDIYPLAPLQEGILLHHLLGTGADAYVSGRLMSFDTEARLTSFIDSLNHVIERHDILRTAVLWEGLPQPLQVVHRGARLVPRTIVPEPTKQEDVGTWLMRQMHSHHGRIDVRHAPMLRAIAAHDDSRQRWLLLLLIHHLIDDNTSVRHIIEEIALLQTGREVDLPAPIPFRNFIAQACSVRGRNTETEAFFREMLGDIVEPTAPCGLLDVHGDGSPPVPI